MGLSAVFVALAMFACCCPNTLACTQEMKLAALKADHFFPVSITKIEKGDAGGWNVSWKTEVTDFDGRAAKRILLYFFPDEGAADFRSGGGFSLAGQSKLYRSSDYGVASFATGVEKNVIIPGGFRYSVYAAAVACDETDEVEIVKARWKPWLNADGSLAKLAPSNDDAVDVQAVIVPGVSADFAALNVYLSGEYPTVRLKLMKAKNVVREFDIPSDRYFELNTFLNALSANRGAVYVNGSGMNWMLSTSDIDWDVATVVAYDGSGNLVQQKQVRQIRTHWAKDQLENVLNLNSELRDKRIDDAGRFRWFTGIWMEGKGVDGGQYLLRHIIDLNSNGKAVFDETDALIEAVRSVPVGGYPLPGRGVFPHGEDGESFSNAYSKVDIGENGGSGPTTIPKDRYYLAWSPGIDLFALTSTGSSIQRIEDCRAIACPYLETPDGITPIFAPLSDNDVNGLKTNGIWVRSTLDDEWQGDGAVSSTSVETRIARDQWRVRLYRYSQGGLTQLSEHSGYVDPRSALYSPLIKIGYEQMPGNIPNISAPEIISWEPYQDYSVLAAYNPQALKLAKVGIGVAGPPKVSATGIVDAEDTDGEQLDDVNLDVYDGPFKNTIHVYPDDGDNGQTIEIGKKYHRVLGVSAANSKDGDYRFLVPFGYYASPAISTILVTGQSDESDREMWRAYALAAARVLRNKYHHYVQVVDLSDWRLGSVYFQKNGLTILEGSEKGELAALLGGRPLYSTTLPLTSLNQLHTGFIVALKQSAKKDLTDRVRGILNSTDAGVALSTIDWHNKNQLENFGFVAQDADAVEQALARLQRWNDADSKDDAVGVINPRLLCYGTSAGGPQCFEPLWLQQNREQIASGVQAVSSTLLSFNPIVGPWWDIGTNLWDLKQGNISGVIGYAQFGLAAVPVYSQAKSVARLTEEAIAIRKSSLAIEAATQVLSSQERRALQSAYRVVWNDRRAANSIWKISADQTVLEASTRRGRMIEEMPFEIFGNSPPRIRGSPPGNYPVIDHFDDVTGLAASLKSIDVTCYSPSRLKSRLRQYEKSLRSFRSGPSHKEIKEIAEIQIKAKKLVLVLERGAVDDVYRQSLDDFLLEVSQRNAMNGSKLPVEVVLEYR